MSQVPVAERFEKLVERLESLENTHLTRQPKSYSSLSYFEGGETIHVDPSNVRRSRRDSERRGSALLRMSDLVEGGYDSKFKSYSSARANFGEFLSGIAAVGNNPNSEAARRFTERYDASKKSLLGALKSQVKAIGLNTFEADSAGSLVLPEFSSTLMQRDYTNDIWGRTDNYTVTGNRMTFPKSKDEDRRDGKRAGGLRAFWKGEEQLLESSRPGVDSVELKLNKLAVVVYVTEELLDDSSYALVEYVSNKVREELDFATGDAVFRGDGIGKPTGFLKSPARVTVSKEGGQAAATLTGKNILEMYRRRVANRTKEYVWFTNQNIETQLHTMQLGTGEASVLAYHPSNGLSAAPYGTLLGLPVIPTEFCETLGTEGDICLVDLGKYLSISKGGVTEDNDTSVEWLRDQVAYKFTMRLDGRPCDDSPIIPYKGHAVNDTQSAFITLETRA
jgi:HK97 family phage major capsid protein